MGDRSQIERVSTARFLPLGHAAFPNNQERIALPVLPRRRKKLAKPLYSERRLCITDTESSPMT